MCIRPAHRDIRTIRDLVESRQDWITHFGMCEKQTLRLRQWYEEQSQDVQQPQPEVGAHVGPLPD